MVIHQKFDTGHWATALGRLKNLTLCMSSYCLLHSKFVITQQDFNIKYWFEFSFLNEILLNPNSEGVPAPHLSEGGGLIQPPPGKCSINGPNELKFCMWPHMGCVWEIPWPKGYNHVSGSRPSPRSKNPKISGILKFGYIFKFFCTELTSKNPKTLPIEFLVKKWSILM